MFSQRNEFNKVLEVLEKLDSSFSDSLEDGLLQLKQLYLEVGLEYIAWVHEMDKKEFPQALIAYELFGRIINQFCAEHLRNKFQDVISSEEMFWWGRMQSRHNNQYVNFNYIMNEYGTEKLLSLSTFDEVTKLCSCNEYKKRFKEDLYSIDLEQYVEYVMFCSKAFDIEIERFLKYAGIDEDNNTFDDIDEDDDIFDDENGNGYFYNLDKAYVDLQMKKELELLDNYGLDYPIHNLDNEYKSNVDGILLGFYQMVQNEIENENKKDEILSGEISDMFMQLTELPRSMKKSFVITDFILNNYDKEILQDLLEHIDKNFTGDSEAIRGKNFLERIAFISWDDFYEKGEELSDEQLEYYEFINPEICSIIIEKMIAGRIENINPLEDEGYEYITTSISEFIKNSEEHLTYLDLFTYIRNSFEAYDYLEKFCLVSARVTAQNMLDMIRNSNLSDSKSFDYIRDVLACYSDDFKKIWISEGSKSENIKLLDVTYNFINLVVRFWINLEHQGNTYLSSIGFHNSVSDMKFVRNDAESAGFIATLLYDYLAGAEFHSEHEEFFDTDSKNIDNFEVPIAENTTLFFENVDVLEEVQFKSNTIDGEVLREFDKENYVKVEEQGHYQEYEVGLVGPQGFRLGYSKLLKTEQETGELCSDEEYLLKIIEIEKGTGVLAFASSELRENVDFIIKAMELDINCAGNLTLSELNKIEIIDYFNDQWRKKGEQLFVEIDSASLKRIVSLIIDEKLRNLKSADFKLLTMGIDSYKISSDGGFWSLIYKKIKNDETLLNAFVFTRLGVWGDLYQRIPSGDEEKRELLLLIFKNDFNAIKSLISIDEFRAGPLVKFLKEQDSNYLKRVKEVCKDVVGINLIMKFLGFVENDNGKYYVSSIESSYLFLEQGGLQVGIIGHDLSGNYCNVHLKDSPAAPANVKTITLEFVFGSVVLYKMQIADERTSEKLTDSDLQCSSEISKLLISGSKDSNVISITLTSDSESIQTLRDDMCIC